VTGGSLTGVRGHGVSSLLSVLGGFIGVRCGAGAAAAGAGVRVVLNDGVVRELSQQLVRVGSNLNQVTRLAHIEARSSGLDAGAMAQMVAVIDQTRATIAQLDVRLEAMSQP